MWGLMRWDTTSSSVFFPICSFCSLFDPENEVGIFLRNFGERTGRHIVTRQETVHRSDNLKSQTLAIFFHSPRWPEEQMFCRTLHLHVDVRAFCCISFVLMFSSLEQGGELWTRPASECKGLFTSVCCSFLPLLVANHLSNCWQGTSVLYAWAVYDNAPTWEPLWHATYPSKHVTPNETDKMYQHMNYITLVMSMGYYQHNNFNIIRTGCTTELKRIKRLWKQQWSKERNCPQFSR